MPRIQLRRDTAANWTSSNPVLASGELGFETDTGKFKFGNGTSTWSTLSYATAGSTLIQNGATGTDSIVVGNSANSSLANYATVSGGQNNDIVSTAQWATISGGQNNLISGTANHCVISGGVSNDIVNASAAFVGGGQNNDMTTVPYGVIGGGGGNVCSNASYAVIVGGRESSLSSSSYAFIGGGYANAVSSASHAVIVGGYDNNISSSSYAFIGGGFVNYVRGNFSAIVGGANNDLGSNSSHCFIGGGADNKVSGAPTGIVIGGGSSNTVVTSSYAVIGGGRYNFTSGTSYNAILGGAFNVAAGTNSTIGGGYFNYASGALSSILGGENNTTTGAYSVVCGGKNNNATHDFSVIAGGCDAVATHPAEMAHAAGAFSVPGDAQVSRFVLRGENNSTTGPTTELALNAATAGLTIPEGTSWHYTIKLVGNNIGAIESAAYTFEGLLERNALSTVILNEISTVVHEDNTAWQVATSIKNAPAFNLNSPFFIFSPNIGADLSSSGAAANAVAARLQRPQGTNFKLLPVGGLYTHLGDINELGINVGALTDGFSVYSNGAVYLILSRDYPITIPDAYHHRLAIPGPGQNGACTIIAEAIYLKSFNTASSEENLVYRFVNEINRSENYFIVTDYKARFLSSQTGQLDSIMYFDTNATQLVYPRLAIDCTVDSVATPTRWVAGVEVVQLKYPAQDAVVNYY